MLFICRHHIIYQKPSRGIIDTWEKYLSVFSPTVWIIFFVSLIGFSLLLHKVAYFSSLEHPLPLSDAVLTVISAVCSMGKDT